MNDVHLTREALDARDAADHGFLDLELDDPRYQRAQEHAGRNAKAQSPGYALWNQWTPAPGSREDDAF